MTNSVCGQTPAPPAQVQAHEVRKCTDVLAKTAEHIQARQRDMSRDVIEPTVQAAMTDAYADCCAEAGPGQYARMRVLMHKAVDANKRTMFAQAAGEAALLLSAHPNKQTVSAQDWCRKSASAFKLCTCGI